MHEILMMLIRDWHQFRGYALYVNWRHDRAIAFIKSGRTSEQWYPGLLHWLVRHHVFPRDW